MFEGRLTLQKERMHHSGLLLEVGIGRKGAEFCLRRGEKGGRRGGRKKIRGKEKELFLPSTTRTGK